MVSALSSGIGGLPAGSWTRERAVLAVVDGSGAAELFAGEGACVLQPDAEARDPATAIIGTMNRKRPTSIAKPNVVL